MANVALSAGVRAALSSLSSTVGSAQQSQLRLATGKKVNSAVDDPVNFFTAASLNDRASQLSTNLDGITNSIQTINAASKGIDSITKLVNSLQSTIKQAQNEAVANRPTKTGGALATSGEVTATGKTLKDIALGKSLVDGNGTTANDATSSYNGNLGVTNAGAMALSITAGSTNYTVAIAAGATLGDVVSSINSSGLATASVSDDGKLVVTGTSSSTVKVGLGTGATADAAKTDALDGGLNTNVGLTTTEASTGIASTISSSVRSNLISQFNDLRDQIDTMAKDSGYNGINLLTGDKLSVTFNEKTGSEKSKLDIQTSAISSIALGIGKLVDSGQAQVNGDYAVQNDDDLAKAADVMKSVLSNLRSVSSTLGSNLSIVQTRQDFTKSMIATLGEGADTLTAADTNEEGAKLLALQTRQQLSQTALSLSNQADQAVLRLF